MFPSLIQRKEAEAYTRSRFRQTKLERIFVWRCYEEWIEVWETIDGTAVTDGDVEAFKLQPRGQVHEVKVISETKIQLSCVCDSGD